MITRDPILITGIERSGGALISRIVSIAGAFSGKVTGRYENIAINKLVRGMYSEIGLSVDNQYPLPSPELNMDYCLREEIKGVMLREGYNNGEWFYKNAAICQTWKTWSKEFPNARWIIVRRKPTEIINSCLLTAYMHSYTSAEIQSKIGAENAKNAWMWWINQHEEYFKGIVLSGVNYMEVWPDRMVRGDYKQIYEMLEWLGLQWTPRIVNEIDPLLNKARKK